MGRVRARSIFEVGGSARGPLATQWAYVCIVDGGCSTSPSVHVRAHRDRAPIAEREAGGISDAAAGPYVAYAGDPLAGYSQSAEQAG